MELITMPKELQFYSEKTLSKKTRENYTNSVKKYMAFCNENHLEMGLPAGFAHRRQPRAPTRLRAGAGRGAARFKWTPRPTPP